MSKLNKHLFLQQAVTTLGSIRARTWLILGMVALGIVSLLIWAGITVLSWLWSQAPAMTEAGKRFTGEAVTQVEQLTPGLRGQVEQWIPGAKEQIEQWLPKGGEILPTNDVSGIDVGPVPRFPGLIRSYFARDGQTIEVRYVGRAALNVVLAHYVQGFTTAGYTQEVMSATPDGEQHRFRRGHKSIDLSLTRGGQSGLVELRLKQLQERL